MTCSVSQWSAGSFDHLGIAVTCAGFLTGVGVSHRVLGSVSNIFIHCESCEWHAAFEDSSVDCKL